MTDENNKKRVIVISVVAVIIITSVILFLSLSGFNSDQKTNSGASVAISSDSNPGENNKEVKTTIKPQDIEGTYREDGDGWTYTINYAPTGEFHGTFTGEFDHSHETVEDNHEKFYTEHGAWILQNGEVKLFIDDVHSKSLWFCGDYMVDSRNYFVGEVPRNKEDFQAKFICKAEKSGDTQILNFYNDGKMIMEIIRDDGKADSAGDSSVPAYQVAVGTYEIKDNLIITKMIGSAEKTLYIVDDGIANWVYNKVNIDK